MSASSKQSGKGGYSTLVASDWEHYTLLDSGGGEKLERWGPYTLRRPETLALWPRCQPPAVWDKVDARFHPADKGPGHWEILRPDFPDTFILPYNDLRFRIELTPYKHTGLFPEQSVNWHWIQQEVGRIKTLHDHCRVLNLFAYTGGATLAGAQAGATEVVHIDATPRIVNWARDNLKLSGLGERHVRFIAEDVLTFVERERRRGREYEAILLDPPTFGRSRNGKRWQLSQDLPALLQSLRPLLNPRHGFLLLNTYSPQLTPRILKPLCDEAFPGTTQVNIVHLGLPHAGTEHILPAGTSTRLSW